MSTELLCNVTMILGIIYDVLQRQPHKVLSNQEEVLLQGDKGYRDVCFSINQARRNNLSIRLSGKNRTSQG